MQKRSIGVFDSGLGGLLVFRALTKKLPQYDYIYLGDTKRVPYGNRSHETIYEFLQEAVNFLFRNRCELIVVACNTASASALRKIQREYLPKHYPNKRVLGVIIPAAETAKDAKRVGVLATEATVRSGTYLTELKKLNPKIKVFQQAAPLLVPLIENNELAQSEPFLKEYLRPLLAEKIDTLILGCTHYTVLKSHIRRIIGTKIRIVVQDNIVPEKLRGYLKRHPEIDARLSRKKDRVMLVTDINSYYKKLAGKWFGPSSKLQKATL